ncbi:hypothetical protein Ct9H90mP29_04520 [bacterium]|nr:MAG: hypothetical protein Ct9H90mP29_04520 [bacterium]
MFISWHPINGFLSYKKYIPFGAAFPGETVKLISAVFRNLYKKVALVLTHILENMFWKLCPTASFGFGIFGAFKVRTIFLGIVIRVAL